MVITSDHGQEFNDNGGNYWGHGSNYTRYQTGYRCCCTRLRCAGVHWHRTTHFDVLPTLMRDHLGCTTPFPSYSVGRSLFEAAGAIPS